MQEYELRQLFLKISNRYSSFAYDDFKVHEWLELLVDTPYELALANVNGYTLNPDNQFPPHPGILADKGNRQQMGPYIPNAEETRLMLEERERKMLTTTTGIPESVRERMRQLGAKSPSTGTN